MGGIDEQGGSIRRLSHKFSGVWLNVAGKGNRESAEVPVVEHRESRRNGSRASEWEGDRVRSI